jgi:hypothetical protein
VTYHTSIFFEYAQATLYLKYGGDSIPDTDQIVSMFADRVGLDRLHIVVLNELRNIV